MFPQFLRKDSLGSFEGLPDLQNKYEESVSRWTSWPLRAGVSLSTEFFLYARGEAAAYMGDSSVEDTCSQCFRSWLGFQHPAWARQNWPPRGSPHSTWQLQPRASILSCTSVQGIAASSGLLRVICVQRQLTGDVSRQRDTVGLLQAGSWAWVAFSRLW